MRSCVVLGGMFVLFAVADLAYGQDSGWQDANPPARQAPVARQPAPDASDQPRAPQDPRLERRPAAQTAVAQGAGLPNAGLPQPPQQPFELTPVEEAQLDRVLLFWQQKSQNVRTFRAWFRRFEYSPIWAQVNKQDPNKPVAEDDGEMRYQTPDKAYYSID
jgi:hypothetical protein